MVQIADNYNYLLKAKSTKKQIVEVHVIAGDVQSAINKFIKFDQYKDDAWNIVSVEVINTVDII